MNANQLNAEFRRRKLLSRVQRGDGYYYWLDDRGQVVDAESVYVYRSDDLPELQWLSLAKEVDQLIRQERGKENPKRGSRAGKVLHRADATDEDLHDLWDVVVLEDEPSDDEAEEAAGLVYDDGEVVAPGVGSLGKFFETLRRSGDMVIATGPLTPEDSRINAEIRRRS